jgi:WD40 repeat protein
VSTKRSPGCRKLASLLTRAFSTAAARPGFSLSGTSRRSRWCGSSSPWRMPSWSSSTTGGCCWWRLRRTGRSSTDCRICRSRDRPRGARAGLRGAAGPGALRDGLAGRDGEAVEVREHNNLATRICFSPDQTLAFTGGKDATLAMWGIEKPQRKSVTVSGFTNAIVGCSGDAAVCVQEVRVDHSGVRDDSAALSKYSAFYERIFLKNRTSECRVANRQMRSYRVSSK